MSGYTDTGGRGRSRMWTPNSGLVPLLCLSDAGMYNKVQYQSILVVVGFKS